MYIPPSFKIEDQQEINQFIKTNNFGTLISTVEGKYFATHLPFLLQSQENGTFLTGHMARANPQWKSLQNQEVLVIFQGPHAYISSSWYSRENVKHPDVVVPTWNYTAVHVYGTFRITDDVEEMKKNMQDQIRFYEPDSYLLNNDSIYEHLFKAIVGFHIDVTRIEAKYKINQKDDEATRQGIIDALLATGYGGDQELAQFMEKFYKTK